MSYFRKKSILLVGGSQGIGRATALALVKEGANIVITARNLEPLEETYKLMQQLCQSQDQSQKIGFIVMDVTDMESIKKSVNKVNKIIGSIDVIVTNVGFSKVSYVDKLANEDFEQLIKVNYLGHVHVIRAFLPAMIERKSGHICLISSLLSFFSCAGYSAYSASKYAIRGFAEGLRQEMLEHNIKVTMFYPGTTDTPGLKKENIDKPASVWKMESESGFNKVHQTEDVAKAILKSIKGGHFDNILGFSNRLVFFLTRRMPNFSRYLIDMEWKKYNSIKQPNKNNKKEIPRGN